MLSKGTKKLTLNSEQSKWQEQWNGTVSFICIVKSYIRDLEANEIVIVHY
jgi:hypothetical protein